ncbi:MAG: hypothetical protein HY279_01750, partial [Nitrospinae bacterium]|nr:hypothetical protein [Nitrospinota bacterium]
NTLETEDKRIKVPVISIDDLIKMKQKAKRAQDIFDIEMLKKVKKIILRR